MRTQRPSFTRCALLCVSILTFSASRASAQTGGANPTGGIPDTRSIQAPVSQARITQAIDEKNLVVLRGNTHPLARAEYDRGLVSDAQPLNRMLLLLQRGPDQETALQQFLDDQQNTFSPSFHRWLTPEQFGVQYGPADADIQTVIDWLLSQGFTQIKVGRGHTVIEFSGNVAQVRNAFRTEIHRYMVNSEAHMANATDPQIPAALAPVLAGVVSLNNFPVKSHVHRLGAFQKSTKTGEVKPLFTFPGCQSGNCYAVGPPDFAIIYNTLPLLNGTPKTDGTGQAIAVVGESNINVQDIADFRTIFGLPQNFTNQNVILNGPDPGINGSETEADLDVQWAGAVAPGATIDFVTSAPTETTSGVHLSALYAIDNNLAGIMSESFGSCEQGLGSTGNQFYNSLWEQAAAQGITVILSAGDGGAAGCDDFNTQQTATHGLAVSGLASTPFNVAVGGTDFDQAGRQSQFWNTTPTTTTPPVPASALKYIPEVPWNDSCGQLGINGCGSTAPQGSLNIAAGSGGVSTIYVKPSWQSGAGVPNDNRRDLPDVSLFASNGFNGSFYIICQRDVTVTPSCNLTNSGYSFQGAGGTSASAPAFAGIMALVNQKMGARQGNANYVLYALAKKPGVSCNSNGTTPPAATCTFNDVTKGNNAVPCAGGTPNCSSSVTGANGVLIETTSGTTQTPAYPSTAGYDLATGLGSVNAQNLVNNWNTINETSTTTALTLNNNAAVNLVHGTSVPVTVSVTPTTAKGDVSLIADLGNGKTIGFDTLTLGTNGTASGTTAALPGGTAYQVHAHYAGDGTNAPSDSTPPVSVTVTPEPSKTFISVPVFDPNTGQETGNLPTSLVYGSSYILRVDVTNAQGSLTSLCTTPNCPTGTVTVTDTIAGVSQGPPNSGTFALNSSGFTEDIPVQFPGGANVISAAYSGDSSFAASAQPTTYTLNVTPAPTQMSVPYIPYSPTLVGQPVNISAFLITNLYAGQAPTGTITFYDGTTPLPGTVTYSSRPGQPGALFASISGTITTTFTTSGTHSMTAQYSGDASYAGATSSALNPTVLWPTTMTQTDSSTNINYGQSITVTAQVTVSSQGPPITGQFRFYGSSTPIPSPVTPTLSIDANGNQVLTATVTTTPQGSEYIQVGYAGDSNYQASGATNFINVIIPDFSITPSPSSLTITAGQTGTTTLTIAPLSSSSSTVALACDQLVLYMGTTCSIAPTSANLANNASATATLTFTTLAPSNTNTAAAHVSLRPLTWPPRPDVWKMFASCSVLTVLFFLVLRPRGWRYRLALTLTATCLVALALGCGGGSSGSAPGGGGGGGGPVPTSITMSSSATKVPQGTAVTLTATITSSKNLTGTVNFWEKNNGGALAPPVNVVNGAAQVQVNLSLVGTHQIYAQYNGDAQNQGSQSGTLNVVLTGTSDIQVTGTTGQLSHYANISVTIQ
jgi:hypothetical protein